MRNARHPVRAEARYKGGVALRLSDVYVYPVKSAAGIRLESAEVVSTGLRFDRRWMIVDDDGTFLSQRTESRLALLRPALEADALRLSAPGREDLVVPFEAPSRGAAEVRVWQDAVPAVDAGAEARAWLRAFLQRDVRLVAFPSGAHRAVDPERARPGDGVAFADGYPFLLTSTASLAELNLRLPHPVEMIRFRPNLVVDGAEPFAEDEWRRIRIGDASFRVVKPCARCAITSVDPATGQRGPEPLRALAEFRRRNGKVLFGQNLIHDGAGRLRQGDAVELLEA